MVSKVTFLPVFWSVEVGGGNNLHRPYNDVVCINCSVPHVYYTTEGLNAKFQEDSTSESKQIHLFTCYGKSQGWRHLVITTNKLNYVIPVLREDGMQCLL